MYWCFFDVATGVTQIVACNIHMYMYNFAGLFHVATSAFAMWAERVGGGEIPYLIHLVLIKGIVGWAGE